MEVAVRSTNLTLDLLPGPTCSLDSTGREFAVLACILDHCGEPFLTIEALEFAAGECIREITVVVSLYSTNGPLRTYPITPIEERMRASLLFWSSQTMFNSEKIDSTYG